MSSVIFSHNLQAYIFDMDGLLIDSEPLWRRAEISVLKTVGVPLTDDMCKETMGTRLDEMVAYWFQRFPWSGKSQNEVGGEILAEVTSLIAAEGLPMPGVREILELLMSRGEHLGLASSSPPALIEAVLTRLEIKSCFSVVCSAVDEQWGKPHPGVYLTTAKKMNADPALCVAFEDSPAGVESARKAGMTVVAVSPDCGQGKFVDAHWEVDSLVKLLPLLTNQKKGPKP
jgi:mannitol-1-/sugar-/sorbitol-6-/2-deoxyglucose-6-phosphatase